MISLLFFCLILLFNSVTAAASEEPHCRRMFDLGLEEGGYLSARWHLEVIGVDWVSLDRWAEKSLEEFGRMDQMGAIIVT